MSAYGRKRTFGLSLNRDLECPLWRKKRTFAAPAGLIERDFT